MKEVATVAKRVRAEDFANVVISKVTSANFPYIYVYIID